MNTIEKKVKIKLTSTILPVEGEREKYELWLQGLFVEKSGKSYLRYQEVMDEKTIQTTVKLSNENALIMRSGGVNMRLPFNATQKEHGHYNSQYGTLPILTQTHQLTHEHHEEEFMTGHFFVQYDLIISGQTVGNYKLEIHYSEGQS